MRTTKTAAARPSRRISIEPPSVAEHRWQCELLVFLRNSAAPVGLMVEKSADGFLHLFARDTGKLIAGTATHGVPMAEIWQGIELANEIIDSAVDAADPWDDIPF
ncbi:hypothetical protein FV218_12315 [Methylobacterium sp. WL69]|uniref:hypothetical protein n=1 Tax=Methylobacterium sp. WL69 TaxID=2603893 RepID=UPI0011C7FDCF|nr:hypothetical protein [Methylobacterium sp. WL69]TXM72916.1 hypothetical protein FV218_12315 [Methylobacterium sp. WL69]